MRPIRTKESNFTYLGPTREIADLPCRRERADTFSVWTLSDAERKAIADGANLRIGIWGMTPIPPISLEVVANDGPWQQMLAPCAICGKDLDDDVHGAGDGTHAWKDRGPRQGPLAGS